VNDLLVRPIHSIPFLVEHDLGVEAHIGRYEGLDTWPAYVPHVRAVHLPYKGCNLAALDDSLRQRSLQMIREAMDQALPYKVDRLVMHICGIESKDGSLVGSYDRLIAALQELAGHAAKQRRTLCLENTVLQWGGAVKHWGDSRACWYRIYRDAGRENVKLTLDTK
jgi:sugar phosphate isomerase/epimerase